MEQHQVKMPGLLLIFFLNKRKRMNSPKRVTKKTVYNKKYENGYQSTIQGRTIPRVIESPQIRHHQKHYQWTWYCFHLNVQESTCVGQYVRLGHSGVEKYAKRR